MSPERKHGGKRIGAGRREGSKQKVVSSLYAINVLQRINQDEIWVELAENDDPWVKLAVLKALTDRAFGKPHQSQTIDLNGNLNLSAEARRARLGELIGKLTEAS